MKISIDKVRLGTTILITAIVVLFISLVSLVLMESHQIATLESKVKLHTVPENPVAVKKVVVSVAPTATPTATLKFYPKEGVVK